MGASNISIIGVLLHGVRVNPKNLATPFP